MAPAAVLPVCPGDKVLDLCAAPGGKSTELGARLQGEGLLVSNDISNSRAKALLKKLIAEEDKRKPLSDQKLCERMSAQGCALSRRTVAKYRDELHIPSTTGRKQYE